MHFFQTSSFFIFLVCLLPAISLAKSACEECVARGNGCHYCIPTDGLDPVCACGGDLDGLATCQAEFEDPDGFGFSYLSSESECTVFEDFANILNTSVAIAGGTLIAIIVIPIVVLIGCVVACICIFGRRNSNQQPTVMVVERGGAPSTGTTTSVTTTTAKKLPTNSSSTSSEDDNSGNKYNDLEA